MRWACLPVALSSFYVQHINTYIHMYIRQLCRIQRQVSSSL